jgi:2-succinyl-6-hydroxy-2,4-cyclohexadiene-1-carboxylate synthase
MDLPGHGESAAIRADLPESADLVVATALAAGLDDFALAGYSLGGRIALHVAARHPERLSRLATIGATLSTTDPGERAERLERDMRLADHIEEVGAEVFLAEWLAQPMFAGAGDAADVASRSQDTAGLAASLRMHSVAGQNDLRTPLHHFSAPTVAIAGALDTKFVAAATEIVRVIPQATRVLVPEGHHACHIEWPDITADIVRAALS